MTAPVKASSRPTRRAVIQARARALAGPVRAAAVQAAIEPAAEGDDAPVAATTAELWLYGVVGGYWWGFDAESVGYALRSIPEEVTDVIVRVHSPGGGATEGIAIGNLFRNHPARFTGVVDGIAASAASVLILGCDDIVVSPGGQFMIHDVSTYTYGNQAQLLSDASYVGKQSANYAEVYATRGGTAEEWRTAMTTDNGRGTWYTASEAVEAGLADRVGTIQSVTPPPLPPEPDDDFDEGDLEAAAAWDRDVLCHPDAWAAWSSTPGALPRPPKPPSASAVGSIETEGGPAVAFSDEQLTTMRASLQLEETADEAAILAAVETVVAENLEERPPATPTAGIPEGHVVIPAAKLADLEAGAALATQTAKSLSEKERDAFLDSQRGKYLPTSREAWAAEYDRDPKGTREHFAKAPVIIPTTELGHDNPVEESKTETDAAYDAVWGPDENKEA